MKPLVDQVLLDRLSEWRQALHAQAELSGQEVKTARLVTDILKDLQPDALVEGLGGHGVMAVFRGKGEGPRLLFRAELDALPIEEINEVPYRSRQSGVSHKCGHDGHMAILLGLAAQLAEQSLRRGSVYLLFQPAEEDGSGAMAVLEDENFPPVSFDYVFALHNLPGYPLGSVVVRQGAFTAAVRSLVIKLKGKTAHAAEPENGINPAPAIAELLLAAQQLERVDPQDPDFGLITPVYLTLGERAYGVAAGYGEVHVTLRSWTPEGMQKLSAALLEAVEKGCATHRLDREISWTNTFFANFNAPEAVSIIAGAAAFNQFPLIEREMPLKWGEDFGAFTQRYKGAMFGLGAGTHTAALHNPDYDFPDQLIEHGAKMLGAICKALL